MENTPGRASASSVWGPLPQAHIGLVFLLTISSTWVKKALLDATPPHEPPSWTSCLISSLLSLVLDVTFVILLEKAGINIFIILFNSWIVCETPEKKTRMHL